MKKVKSKIAIGILCAISFLVAMSLTVQASTEDKKVEIVKLVNDEYVIYIADNLTTEFEFAFSTGNEEEPTTYLPAGTEGENTVAFRNETTIQVYGENAHYLWVKTAENAYILKAKEIDWATAMTTEEVDKIQNLTKTIQTTTTQVKIQDEVVDGKNIQVTVGAVEIKEEGTYTYQIVKVPETGDYRDFVNLADRISKFTDETDMYTKLSVYHAFYAIYTQLHNALVADAWENVVDSQILQPEDAQNGDQYIVWIKGTNANGTVEDVQFLTSDREDTILKEREQIITKLPVTYDNNVLLFVLAGLVVVTIAVSVRIKMLENKKQ